MNIKFTLCGFSKETDELVFEIDLDESRQELVKLFSLDPNDQFIDIQEINTESEKNYFENKYDVNFDNSVSYSVHIYQK